MPCDWGIITHLARSLTSFWWLLALLLTADGRLVWTYQPSANFGRKLSYWRELLGCGLWGGTYVGMGGVGTCADQGYGSRYHNTVS